jgi:hypothetical protein
MRDVLRVTDQQPKTADQLRDESYLSRFVGSLVQNESLKNAITFEAKVMPMFVPGYAGLAGTMVTSALDRAHPTDSLSTQIIDFGLGATEGAALKGIYGVAGRLPGGFFSKGMALGVASNFMDTALDRHSYLTQDGSFSLATGLGNSWRSTFDGGKIGLMVGTMALGGGTLAFADSFTGGLMSRSPFISTVLAGSTMGFFSGALGEMNRQGKNGQEFSLGRILLSGGESGLLTGIAAAPGGAISEVMANRAPRAAQAPVEELRDPQHGKVMQATKDINGRPRYVYEDGAERVYRADDVVTTYTKDGQVETHIMPTLDSPQDRMRDAVRMRNDPAFVKQPDGSYVRPTAEFNKAGSITVKPDGTYIDSSELPSGKSRVFTILPDGSRTNELITPATHPSAGVTKYGDEIATRQPDGSIVRSLDWGLKEILRPDGTYIAGTGHGSSVSISKPDGTWAQSELDGVHHQVDTKYGTSRYYREIGNGGPDSIDNDWLGRMSDRLFSHRFDAQAVNSGTVNGIKDLWYDRITGTPAKLLQGATADIKALGR